jgi:hypothetical protein
MVPDESVSKAEVPEQLVRLRVTAPVVLNVPATVLMIPTPNPPVRYPEPERERS